jgi:DNA-binding MarR family transcriptional regulator
MESGTENGQVHDPAANDELAWRWLKNLHVLKVMVREVLEGECPLPNHDNQLTFSQVNLIKLIQRGCDEEEGWSLRKLARYMQVSLPAVSKAIGRLTPQGYLVLKGDTKDGRKRRVTVTGRGLEALDSFKHCREERLRTLLSMGAIGNLSSWNEGLEDMVELMIRLCRGGHVPGLACDCPDEAAHSHERHAPGCPVRRHLHHLDE